MTTSACSVLLKLTQLNLDISQFLILIFCPSFMFQNNEVPALIELIS